MYEAFGSSDITVAEQTAICDIVTKIVGYGFTTEDAEASAALAELAKGVVPFYNSKLVNCAEWADSGLITLNSCQVIHLGRLQKLIDSLHKKLLIL